MRIVHYLSEIVLAHGGVVRAVLDLCAGLAGAGHEVQLMCFDNRDVPGAWKQGGPLIPKAIKLNWPERAKPIRRFKKEDLLRAEGIIAGARVLHLHGPWEATNPQLAEIALRREVPYVVSIHGMMDDWTIRQGHRWLKRLYLAFRGRQFLQQASCVLCTAEAELKQARKWLRGARTEVLPLLVDLEPYRNPPDAQATRAMLSRVPGDGPLVLFLSRLHPKKGVEHLLRAAARLWREGLRFRLAIVGGADAHAPAYEGEMRALANELGIGERAAFLGLVVGPEKTALIRSARVMVLPTSQENWGFVPIESLALGRPVVTTRGVDIWPELEKSGGALIVGQNAEEIAGAIRRLIEDEALADEMGSKGREWVMRDLDPRAVLARYEDLYRSLS